MLAEKDGENNRRGMQRRSLQTNQIIPTRRSARKKIYTVDRARRKM
jgi:hypothetical protein